MFETISCVLVVTMLSPRMCTLHAGRKATPVYIAEIIGKSGDGFLFGLKYRTRVVVVSTTQPVRTSDTYAVAAMPAGASWGLLLLLQTACTPTTLPTDWSAYGQ